MARLGIFGGTFDPVHIGHVAMVRRALEWGLGGVAVVPCHRSPHKPPDAGAPTPAAGEHRWEMLKLAFRGRGDAWLSRLELDRSGPSYTRDTIGEFQRRHPDAEWFLIMGGDQLPGLRRWIGFDEWAPGVRFLVFSRPGFDLDPGDAALQGLRADVINDFAMPVSATEVRARLAKGESVRGMLPEGVEAYIRQHGLYGAGERGM